MQRLQVSTREVSEIVAVIDDIAFQTGMLALNATVEASHAGETGKGFAVVAQEVRQLAQRCAESADQIRRRVAEAESAVAESGERLAQADQVFATLRDGVGEIASRLRSIAESSVRQNDRIGEISERVGSLDSITRQNAALVEEATASARTLVERAQSLRETVATIRLRHGSVDEARAMAEHAHRHIEAVGREQALADFQDPNGPFQDRDLYIFGLARDGVYFALGTRPDLVGAHLEDMDVADATALLADMWRLVDAQGSGWTRYGMNHPQHGRPVVKESYLIGIGPNELIGCGVYVEAPKASEATRRALSEPA